MMSCVETGKAWVDSFPTFSVEFISEDWKKADIIKVAETPFTGFLIT